VSFVIRKECEGTLPEIWNDSFLSLLQGTVQNKLLTVGSFYQDSEVFEVMNENAKKRRLAAGDRGFISC